MIKYFIMKLNWGNSIFLVLIIFVALGIAFIVFSFSKSNDLVTADYYQQGADYTQHMEVTSRSAVYKDSIQVVNQDKNVVVRFAPAIHRMTDTMQVFFYRPSDKRLDYNIRLRLTSDSIIIAKDRLVNGRYLVKLGWIDHLKSYQVEKEFFID